MALRAAAFVAFFLSGASSLVFQTLWSRLLQHVFGSSSVAISSVVSVFMGGLGLGAYYFGTRADRVRQPLLLYAWAELGVGSLALVIPMWLRSDGWLADVNAVLRNSLGAGSTSFIAARFLCIAPILLVPTFLMGSTLPLLARHFVAHASSPGRASREVGRLYAVNTFGAVAGVLASSFVLLPRLGVGAANMVAACTNFALAALIFAIHRFTRGDHGAHAKVHEPAALAADAGEPPLPLRMRRGAAIAFSCSGFASLLYEVVWSRALVDTIGGSLYSFALILATFLLGIALGSAATAQLARAHGVAAGRAAVAAACALCIPAAGPLLPQEGALASTIALAVGIGGVLFCHALAASRARRDALFDEAVARASQARYSLVMFAWPALISLAICVREPDRLARASLSVVGLVALLLSMLVVLRSRPFVLLAALQLFVAAATFTSELLADRLSLTFASMVAPLYRGSTDNVTLVQTIMCVTAALCVLPSALGMGAVFPVTMRVWSAGGARIGRDVGLVYAGNTVGSIAGAWLPGFVLMPTFGMQTTLHIGIAVNLCVALGLVLCAAEGPRGVASPVPRAERSFQQATAVFVPVLVALLCLATLRPPTLLAWDISKMTLGAFRISLARDVLDEESWGAPDLVYYRDGLSTTVTVERWGRHYSLKNNGKVDASNGDDMPTQIMVAALPLLMHARPADQLDVAIVGFGSGVTVGAALQFSPARTDVVELERATLEASRFFADVNHLTYESREFPYVRMPRLTVWGDDGRNFLAASPRSYDVIVSEPSNPWLTGVSDLFTLDHFRIAKKKLAPGGIYCQWVQLYELSPDNVRSIYRTFASAFRHVVVFSAEDLSSDTILLGSDTPLPFDVARVERAFRDPKVAAELERAYIHTPHDVLARVLLASRDEVMRFSRGAEINTDDNARIELSAPRDLIRFQTYQGYLETMYAPSWPYGRVAHLLSGFGSGAAASRRYAEQALALLAHGRKAQASAVLARGAQSGPSPELNIAREVHALLTSEHHAPTPALLDAERATPSQTAAPLRPRLVAAYREVQQATESGDYDAAVEKLERVPESLRRDLGGRWSFLEGYLRYRTREHADAIDRFEDLVREDPRAVLDVAELHYFLARAHDALMHFDKGVRNMRAYVEARVRARDSGAPP